jgi:aminoglycoside phosphotransferase (APT) family kinase protein
MHLSDEKILRLARTSLARLTAELGDADLQHQFKAIDSALHELMLRADMATESDYYRRGHALAQEGLSLVENPAVAAAFAALATRVMAGADSDTCQRALAALTDCLRQIVQALGAVGDAAGKDYLTRVCGWEGELAQRRGNRLAAIDAVATSAGLTRAGLEDYLRRKFPQRGNLRVSDFNILAGGFSKRTIFFSIEDDSGREALVIRANQPAQNIKIEGADVRNEYPILLMAFKAGLPLPEPLWLESDESVFGVSFLVCRKAAGKTIGSGHTSQVFQTITPAIRADLVKTLIQIHATPIDASNAVVAGSHLARWLPHRDLHSIAIASVDFWMQEVYDQGAVIGPTLQRVYDWLIANAPPPLPFTPVFLHGDYGLHNILFDGERISAVLDWEIAKIGDPAEEFLPVFMSLSTDYDEALIRDYVAAGGQPVSRFRVSYYLLLIMLRVLAFDASALQILATADHADMNLFNWLTGTSAPMLRDVNALIARAEREREEEFGSRPGR